MALEQTASGRWTGDYIVFDEQLSFKEDHITNRWDVSSKHGEVLGVVRWFSRWRKYAFFAEPNCVFEQVCLRDIAQFIEERTRDHKAKG